MTKLRRLATTGVAYVAVLGLAVTGCGNPATTDAPAANGGAASAAPAGATTADPADELRAAVRRLNEESMRIHVSSTGLRGTGLSDPKVPAMDMTMELGTAGETRVLMIGRDAYVKMGGQLGAATGGSGKWLHLDTRNLGSGGQLGLMPADDPVGVRKLLDAVVEVRRIGPGTFVGTLDYSKSMADSKTLADLGDKAKAVPFTATVNEQGRLKKLGVDTTVVSPMLGPMSVIYSDWGTPVSVSRPPAIQVVEAPTGLTGAGT
ncbi:hypothetical protein ACFYMB_13185 [Micromonospora haikouensis]|uniref:hypothetical protein n=1 Tax=Micromonospora haikouensis TaxID=686309 RepID=UPI0034182AA6